jgi:RNA polymerase primary sigma factor
MDRFEAGFNKADPIPNDYYDESTCEGGFVSDRHVGEITLGNTINTELITDANSAGSQEQQLSQWQQIYNRAVTLLIEQPGLTFVHPTNAGAEFRDMLSITQRQWQDITGKIVYKYGIIKLLKEKPGAKRSIGVGLNIDTLLEYAASPLHPFITDDLLLKLRGRIAAADTEFSEEKRLSYQEAIDLVLKVRATHPQTSEERRAIKIAKQKENRVKKRKSGPTGLNRSKTAKSTSIREGDLKLDPDIEPNSILALDGLKLFEQRMLEIPVLQGKAEAHALAKRIEKGDLAARDRFIEANLRLAFKWAGQERYKNRGLELADLVQAAIIGLIRAVDKYDWRRNVEFSTYATNWLDYDIERALANTGRTVRMPEKDYKMHRKVVAIYRKLAENYPASSLDDLYEKVAEEADITVSDVYELLSRWYGQQPDSLDRPLDQDSPELSLGSTLPFYNQEAESSSALSHPALREALDTLPEFKRDITVLAFGIEGAEVMSSSVQQFKTLHRDTIRKNVTAALQELGKNRKLIATLVDFSENPYEEKNVA